MTTLDARARTGQPRFAGLLRSQGRVGPALQQSAIALADATVIAIVSMLALASRFGADSLVDDANLDVPMWIGNLVPFAWLLMLAAFGAYSLPHLHTGMTEYQRVAVASALMAGVVGVGCYLTHYPLSRQFFVVLFCVGLPALLIVRFARRRILNTLRRKGLFQAQVLVAGSSAHIDEIARVLRRETWLGYQVVGAVTADGTDETPAGLPVLGRVADVVDLVGNSDVEAVIFAEGSFPDSQHFKRMAWELEEHAIQMIVVPALTDISAERLHPRPVAGMPLVHVERPQALAASRWGKRLFDIVGSSILLLFSAPVLALVALAVKIEDRGPVLFKQTRVGRRGEEFECLKIRSMVVDAEARKAALETQNEGAGVLFKMAKDPRITRVGHFIRRFSIDEVPQFWNVLRGDMSLVGPRPALPKEVAQYDRDAVRRLDVRPGLTGLWQVSGRSNLSWDETVRLDVYYVDNWSVMQDLTILMRTAGAVLGSRGAY